MNLQEINGNNEGSASRPAEPGSTSFSGVRLLAPRSLLGKLLAFLSVLLALFLLFAFSVVLLAVGAVVGLVVWGYFKYRSVAIRRAHARGDFSTPRAARPQPAYQTGEPAGGRIIEGEGRREDHADAPRER